MNDNPYSEALLVRYLLGDLPEEEQAEVEERAFRDPQTLRHIEAAESDLIDEYVRGGLSARERQQFEGRFFVSAERRRKVEFARALAHVAPEFVAERDSRTALAAASTTRPRFIDAFLRGLSPAFRYALAAAALLIVIGGAWLIVEGLRLRTQLAELRAERQAYERQQQALQQQVADEQARREDLSAQLQREREERERNQQLVGELQHKLEESAAQPSPSAQSSPAAVVSLALWPGISRSGGTRANLRIPQAAQRVRLQVGVEPGDEYRSFRVELRAPDGQPAWTQANLSARRVRGGRAVTLNLPAAIFKAGEYELALKGVTAEGKTEDVGYYYVDVTKK